MRLILIILIFTASFTNLSMAQEVNTQWLNEYFRVIDNPDQASYKQINEINSEGIKVSSTYSLSDELLSKVTFKPIKKSGNNVIYQRDGEAYFYIPKKRLKVKAQYENDQLNGEVISTYTNGQLYRKQSFNNNEAVSDVYLYDSLGNTRNHIPFMQSHAYGDKGGMQEWYNYLSKGTGVLTQKGLVQLSFYVTESGEVADLYIHNEGQNDKSVEKTVYNVVNRAKKWKPELMEGALTGNRVEILVKVN